MPQRKKLLRNFNVAGTLNVDFAKQNLTFLRCCQFMEKKSKIYFVRHGESEANVKGTFAGQKEDSPLTTKGKDQARLTAMDLVRKKIKPSKVIVSPLVRAYETATIIIEHAKLDDVQLVVDQRVAEYDMGSLTGTPIRKVSSVELVSAEGAEDPEMFMNRVHGMLDELTSLEEVVLVVSHAGVGRIIEAKKKAVAAANFYDLDPLPNAVVIELEI